MTDEVEYIKQQLLSALNSDLVASDFLVSIFWTAVNSYRHDTVLRPFPQLFILQDNSKDIDGIRALLSDLPNLKTLKQHINSIDTLSLQLLRWIICTKTFTVVSVPVNEFATMESQNPNSVPSTKPYSVFELVYSAEIEQKWTKLVGNRGTFIAYHGSRVENFHSITHNGLLSHMNKLSLFGEGTYLSTDIGVCMNFSPSSASWPQSMLPTLCSMVAVCEVINHPEVRSRVQRGGEPSLSRRIPEQYFVVTNNELVRVKYILVFAQERRVLANPSYKFLSNNKWILMITLYMFLLLCVGLWQSRYLSKLYYQHFKKF